MSLRNTEDTDHGIGGCDKSDRSLSAETWRPEHVCDLVRGAIECERQSEA